MSEKIRWGVVGAGWIANNFLEALVKSEKSECIAITTQDENTAKNLVAQYNLSKTACLCVEDIVCDDKIDAFFIASPLCSLDTFKIIIENEKALVRARPFSISSKDLKLLFDLAKTKNCFLMEAHWPLLHPAIEHLNQMIQGNQIGSVSMLSVGGGFHPYKEVNNDLFNADQGGGVLMDSGIDLIALAVYFLGKPQTIKSVASFGEGEVDEQDAILMTFKTGAIANLFVTMKGSASPDLKIIGENGTLSLKASVTNPKDLILKKQDAKSVDVKLPQTSSSFHLLLKHAEEALIQGKTASDKLPPTLTMQINDVLNEVRLQIGLRFPNE